CAAPSSGSSNCAPTRSRCASSPVAPPSRQAASRAFRSSSSARKRSVSALSFRKREPRTSYVGFTDRPGFANAREIGEELTARYVDEELDRVELVYNHYVSPL